MSNIDYKKYLKAIYEPIVAVAELPTESSEKLTTSALPKKEIQKQNSIIKSFEVSTTGAIEISNSNFAVRFSCSDGIFFAISVDNISTEDKESFVEILLADGLEAVDLQIGMFMSLRLNVKYNYKIKSSLNKYALIEKLGLTLRELQEGYSGHSFEELIDVFKEVKIFKIPADSAYIDKSDWYVVANLATKYNGFRFSGITEDIVEVANSLLSLDTINPENVYLSLTSSHWKHSFLEIYRCLEALYYLPWMLKLKEASKTPHNAFNLAKICAKTVSWREKEEDSIVELFCLFPALEVEGLKLGAVQALRDVDHTSMKALARRIYKIRNQCVHQEDYEEIDKFVITSECWQILILLVFNAVHFFYHNYTDDIKTVCTES